jgi:glycine cleavage system aminomethyltransferase T
VLDATTLETIVDAKGRRSRTTSMTFGPSIGKTIALCYLPPSHALVGTQVLVEYFGEQFAAEVAGVGYAPLYDPENIKPRS